MSILTHPTTRREILQVGTIGLMGLSLTDVMRQQASGSAQSSGDKKIRSVIYVFLSGGLSQHESFDMKPLAPDTVRGEFSPISTKTPTPRSRKPWGTKSPLLPPSQTAARPAPRA